MTLEEKYSIYLDDGRRQGLAEGKEQGLAEGKEQGLAEGREQGLAEGREQGLAEGKNEAIQSFVASRKKDGYTDEEIAKEVKHIFSVDLNK